MGCVVDEPRALPPPAALVKQVQLTHPGGQRVTIAIEFAQADPPAPDTGTFFYNVDLKANPGAGRVLKIQSPHDGRPWVSDASELDHPDRSTLVSAETSGSALTLTLDLQDQAGFLGQGRFAPRVIVRVVGQQPARGGVSATFVFYSPQSCGWDTPAVSGPASAPVSTPSPPPNVLSDADSHGFLTYPGARCANTDQAAVVERTARSAVVICRIAAGGYEYRGSRLSDGVSIRLPGATPIGGGFTVVNPTDGTQYEVRREGLTVKEDGGQSRSEPSLEYASS